MLPREWVATLSDKPLSTLVPAYTDRPVAPGGSAINDKGVDSLGYESAGFRRINLVPGNQYVFVQVLALVILAAHPFFECREQMPRRINRAANIGRVARLELGTIRSLKHSGPRSIERTDPQVFAATPNPYCVAHRVSGVIHPNAANQFVFVAHRDSLDVSGQAPISGCRMQRVGWVMLLRRRAVMLGVGRGCRVGAPRFRQQRFRGADNARTRSARCRPSSPSS